MVEYSLAASKLLEEKGIDCEVVNMRFIKPLDEELIDTVAGKFNKIVTLEENSIVGGFGSGVVEYMSDKGYKNDLLRIGLPDSYVEHGTQAELHKMLGIDAKGIAKRIEEYCQ